MSTMPEFKVGDRVVLLSIPGFNEADDTTHPDVGNVYPIDKVRRTAADGSVWHDVAGWIVRAQDIRLAGVED